MLPKAKANEVLNWFIKAKRDVTIAEINLATVPPVTDDAMFHSQQAVEKALKGFLVLHDRPFKKTHIIGEIALEVLKIDSSLEELLEKSTELTPYATVFRYPGDMELPSIEDAKLAVQLASQIFEEILSRIPEEVRPT